MAAEVEPPAPAQPKPSATPKVPMTSNQRFAVTILTLVLGSGAFAGGRLTGSSELADEVKDLRERYRKVETALAVVSTDVRWIVLRLGGRAGAPPPP